jgi:hypothetical protein
MPGGDEVGEATCAQMTHRGEEIVGSKERFRVVDVVSFDEA